MKPALTASHVACQACQETGPVASLPQLCRRAGVAWSSVVSRLTGDPHAVQRPSACTGQLQLTWPPGAPAGSCRRLCWARLLSPKPPMQAACPSVPAQPATPRHRAISVGPVGSVGGRGTWRC